MLEKEKYTLHAMARITLFTCVFCHTHVENLLKWPVYSLKNYQVL